MSYGFRALANPLAEGGAGDGGAGAGGAPGSDEVLAFHRRLPGYEPTPLVSLPRLASSLGVAELLVKVESVRLGLPSFKMLGASWATYRALSERLGAGSDGARDWADVEELAERCTPLLPLRLAAATDGNHGRAVARMARWLGFGARIFVPAGTSAARIEGIEREGAEVVVVDGGYDEAVARSAREEGPDCLVISDTSWPGYVDVPRWVIDGYRTMFAEIDDALAAARRPGPQVVVVPVGVGALAAAAVARFAHGPSAASLIGVEPTSAACVTASALAGKPVTLSGPQDSIMVGLNCGTPSPVAWPRVSRGLAGFVTIDDDWAREAVRLLAASGIEAGETGAAAVGGLLALRRQGRASPLGPLVGTGTRVLVLVTEGASDPPAWRAILGTELVGGAVR